MNPRDKELTTEQALILALAQKEIAVRDMRSTYRKRYQKQPPTHSRITVLLGELGRCGFCDRRQAQAANLVVATESGLLALARFSEHHARLARATGLAPSTARQLLVQRAALWRAEAGEAGAMVAYEIEAIIQVCEHLAGNTTGE